MINNSSPLRCNFVTTNSIKQPIGILALWNCLDWRKIPCNGLNTEPRRGAEVWCSFRPSELQNVDRLLWDFSAMMPKINCLPWLKLLWKWLWKILSLLIKRLICFCYQIYLLCKCRHSYATMKVMTSEQNISSCLFKHTAVFNLWHW